MCLPLAEPCVLHGCSNRGVCYKNTGSVTFFVRFFFWNIFERVPLPRVTENRYGAEQRTAGMVMIRSEFSILSKVRARRAATQG